MLGRHNVTTSSRGSKVHRAIYTYRIADDALFYPGMLSARVACNRVPWWHGFSVVDDREVTCRGCLERIARYERMTAPTVPIGQTGDDDEGGVP